MLMETVINVVLLIYSTIMFSVIYIFIRPQSLWYFGTHSLISIESFTKDFSIKRVSKIMTVMQTPRSFLKESLVTLKSFSDVTKNVRLR